MSPQNLALFLNLIGLVLNTAGAFAIWWFGSPPLRLTPGGGNLDVWVATPGEPERSRNAKRYLRHKRLAGCGLLAIALGFLCQLIGLGIGSLQ
jgi:hypothetical protein